MNRESLILQLYYNTRWERQQTLAYSATHMIVEYFISLSDYQRIAGKQEIASPFLCGDSIFCNFDFSYIAYARKDDAKVVIFLKL